MNTTASSTQGTSRITDDVKLVDISLGWKIFTMVVMTTILVLTIIGNIAVIAVQSRSIVLKNIVNSYFLVSLSIADLLVAILVMPCALDTVNTGSWRCGNIWGKFNGFGNFLFCISSIMHLMMLSIDRYMAIARPLRYPLEMTKSRALTLCLILWSYSAVWACLPLFGVSSYECFISYIGTCKAEDWSKNSLNFAFAISVVSGTYGIALISMVYIYFKIGLVIRMQIQRIQEVSNNPQQTRDKNFKATFNNTNSKHCKMAQNLSRHKGLATLLVVTLAYLVCWSPFCIMLFIEIGSGKKINGPFGTLAMLMGFVNSCCNPIIYSIKYRSFRLAVASMLCRKNLVHNMSRKVLDDDRGSSLIIRRKDQSVTYKESYTSNR